VPVASLAGRGGGRERLAGEADDLATVVDVVALGDVAGVAGVLDLRGSAGAPHDSTAFPNELGNAAVVREVLAHAHNQFCSDRNSQLLERFDGGPGATPSILAIADCVVPIRSANSACVSPASVRSRWTNSRKALMRASSSYAARPAALRGVRVFRSSQLVRSLIGPTPRRPPPRDPQPYTVPSPQWPVRRCPGPAVGLGIVERDEPWLTCFGVECASTCHRR
jgi:hypothetical protein